MHAPDALHANLHARMPPLR